MEISRRDSCPVSGDDISSGVEANSAPRPRPRPRCLFMLEHLSCELQVGQGAAGAKVVEHDRPSVAWRFGQANVARDHGVEDFAWKITMHLLADLLRDACSTVEHREDDTRDR